MDSSFNFAENLPWIISGIFVLASFALFVWGGVSILRAKGIEEKTSKGRKILLTAFFSLFVILLVALSFSSTSFILNRGEIFRPQDVEGEFPGTPAVNFPPPLQFIGIGSHAYKFGVGRYYFSGPFPFKKASSIDKPAIFAVLCKKDGNYDIMDIGVAQKTELSEDGNYSCWLENCSGQSNQIYLGILRNKFTPLPGERVHLEEEIKSQMTLPCQRGQANSDFYKITSIQ